MPTCIYCGHRVRFFRNQHPECRQRHERAMANIPEFFIKVLQSDLSPERFRALLQQVAEDSYIKLTDFQSLTVSGLSRMIEAALEDRLMTPAEQQRVREIVDAFGLPPAITSALYQKMLKADMIRDLKDGRIPDRVTVVGPLPITLREQEKVVWILNHVNCLNLRDPPDSARDSVISIFAAENSRYYGTKLFKTYSLSSHRNLNGTNCDLIFTSRNLFLISSNGHKRISISKIMELKLYADGVIIVFGTTRDEMRTLKLDDPWFVTNLVIGLQKVGRK